MTDLEAIDEILETLRGLLMVSQAIEILTAVLLDICDDAADR